MVIAYGAARRTAPPYLQAMLKPYTPTLELRTATSVLLALPPITGWQLPLSPAQALLWPGTPMNQHLHLTPPLLALI
jgi:hypothetical protein